jgi:hypothetical protein
MWACAAAAAIAAGPGTGIAGAWQKVEQAHPPTMLLTSKTVTSEEVRLSDLRRGDLQLTAGQHYRVVGRIRSLDATSAGLPRIVFTGLHAVLSPGFDRGAVESLEPNDYIAVDCVFTKPKDNIFPLLDGCTNLTRVTTVSAPEYEAAYDQNPFRADSKFKDRDVVIYGEVRLTSKLVDGRDYVDLHAQKGFSAVTAILAPEARQMIPEYAKRDEIAVMLCRGGYRYNLVGSVGLKDCRFLQNY